MRVFTFVYSLLFGALRMSGGYFQFQAPQLRVMPVPVADFPIQRRVAELVDQIIDAKAKDPNEDTQPQKIEIDELLYDLYGLTQDEIAIVEGRNT